MEKINDALTFILGKIKNTPEIGIILGSGLNIANDISTKNIIYYSDIPNFPVSTVDGHEGRFLFGNWNGKEVVIMQGRLHYYEGYSMQEVTMPIRIMGLLGIKKLILTNAAGGISVPKGEIMIIKDHISNFVPSPLIGKNDIDLGPRFPDMSDVYNKADIEKLKQVFNKLNLNVFTGTYVQTSGPQYETPAEIKMLKLLIKT
jgi:purine-nucleoside phosphorylase